MRRLTLVLAILLVSAGSAPAGARHLAVQGLSGETLSASGFASHPLDNGVFISGTCDPTGRSTFTYTARGSATGPYIGTFEEHGTFTIGPMIDPPPGRPAGELLKFSARFTITSFSAPLGVVEGTKALHGNRDVSTGASCSPSGVVFVGVSGLRYRATIEYFGETCHDRGISTVTFEHHSVTAFRETFASDDGLARCGGRPSQTTTELTGDPETP